MHFQLEFSEGTGLITSQSYTLNQAAQVNMASLLQLQSLIGSSFFAARVKELLTTRGHLNDKSTTPYPFKDFCRDKRIAINFATCHAFELNDAQSWFLPFTPDKA